MTAAAGLLCDCMEALLHLHGINWPCLTGCRTHLSIRTGKPACWRANRHRN
jgi:hypothetical protein